MVARDSGWRQESRDFLRAIAAGTIFGMPLLFTMEMWWRGAIFTPLQLIVILGMALLLNFVLSLFLGFRSGHGVRHGVPGGMYSVVARALSESLTSVALGAVISAVMLCLIGEISKDLALYESIGKITIQASMVSLGISVTNAKFRSSSVSVDASAETSPFGAPPFSKQAWQDMKDVGATLVGALFFSFNLAPTEEIVLIANRLSPERLILLLASEILLCYIILFASGFWKRRNHDKGSPFQSPIAETLMASAFSVLVAMAMIAMVGHEGAAVNLELFVSTSVVLACPAIVGGAAGRLVL